MNHQVLLVMVIQLQRNKWGMFVYSHLALRGTQISTAQSNLNFAMINNAKNAFLKKLKQLTSLQFLGLQTPDFRNSCFFFATEKNPDGI